LGTRRDGTKPSTGAEWTIEADADDDSVYLKNVLLGQYLYATEDKFPSYSQYREMALAPKRQTDEFKWKFLPQDDTGNKFFVQNVAYEENLSPNSMYSTSTIWTMCTYKGTYQFTVQKC
jgi:septin family protein